MKRIFLSIFFIGLITTISNAQVGGWNPDLVVEARKTLEEMINENPKLKSFHKQSFGYAVFPKVIKAGLGVGGAIGNGIVFMNDNVTGKVKLKQASLGIQAGGQQYSEIIFFENKKAFEHFTNNNLKFDAQASAVALKKGVSIDVAYHNGVAVFTRAKGGIMYEASVGGQHFKYKTKK